MSTENALEDKLENAMLTWLAATATHSIDLSRFAKRASQEGSADNLTLPALIVTATREEEEILGTGVWRCKLVVALHSQADDTTDAQLEQDWHDVMAVVLWDDLAARLSDTSGVRVYACLFTSGTDRTINDRHWEQTITFQAMAMSTD
jgi:hypothetical protein